MNTHQNLQSEFDRLAVQQAPPTDDIRQELAERHEERGRRRRNTTWIAAAAAVVLVAGGVGLTRGALHDGPATFAASGGAGDANQAPDEAPGGAVNAPEGPAQDDAADPAVPDGTEDTPQGPAQDDVQLVPTQPQTVTSPVAATAPEGLSGRYWQEKPEALAVTWFDRDAMQEIRDAAAADPDLQEAPTVLRQVGYVITDDRDGDLRTFGSTGGNAPTVKRSPTTIAGHDATLEIAAHGTVDTFGSSADDRITWQLGDGRWIHVWSAGGDADTAPSPMLKAFAASVTEDPQTLKRGVSIGLTVLGLDHVFSTNEKQLPGYDGMTVYLCPDGIDPFQPDFDSLGTTRAESEGTATDGGSAGDDFKSGPCISADVGRSSTAYSDSSHMAEGTVVTVGDTTAHVLLADYGIPGAWADLTDQLMVQVSAPWSADLSTEQLAQLAASVQLNPDMPVAPGDGS